MKKLLPLFFLLLLVSWKWRNKTDEIPPGTVRVETNFFVDAAEIRNSDWREFQYWILRHIGEDSAFSILPDTLTWRSKENSYDSYIELYYRHPAYNDYPVVGISFNQAIEFTKWRTHRVLEYMLIRDKKDVNINLNPGKCFTPQKYFEGNWQESIPDSNFRFPVFRLPTKEEWLKFSGADSLYKYPFGFKIGKRMSWSYKMDSTAFLCKQPIDSSEYKEFLAKHDGSPQVTFTKTITAPVRSGFLNENAIYCTIGNVSEMTSEEGIAMGGNFELNASQINLQESIAYTKSEHWLGFRCVAEFMNWKEYQKYLQGK